jgi:hypothetical protein
MGYDKGKIYVLRSHQTDDLYIGSTIQPIYKRFYTHKNDFKRWKGGKQQNYLSSYELMKYDDVYIELLEEYPCKNKMELLRREGELIREMKCVNKHIAGRTRKEYREDNKDKRKKYREDNKDKLKEYREENKDKINKKINCECGGKYTHQGKARHLKRKKHINHFQ